MSKAHIDFGHGGRDPGAVCNGLKEKNIALVVGLEVCEILERHNVEVSYSRTDDTFIELSHRAAIANKFDADIFVSLHINSATNKDARGVETFSLIGSSKGAILAKNIQDQLTEDKIFTVNRGTKTANFAVLRLTKMPAALVELGFISNPEDANILRNKQSEIAKSVAKGILNYLGIKYVGKKEDHWGEEVYQKLINKGIVFSEKRFDDNPTRAETFAMINKVTDWVEEKLKEVK